MDELSGTQIFIMALCLILVLGAVGIAWAEAWGKRRRRPVSDVPPAPQPRRPDHDREPGP